MSRFALVLTSALVAQSAFADKVTVKGTNVSFDTTITANVGGKSVPLTLTGTALRTKLLFNVYAMGSYVQEGVEVKSAEDLARLDAPKQLYLVMVRSVSGADMAAAVQESITANYPEGTFPEDMKKFTAFLSEKEIEKGSRVCVTHLPGTGVMMDIDGKRSLTIQNPTFSKAIWDIYLGPKNIGVAIKQGLTSRL